MQLVFGCLQSSNDTIGRTLLLIIVSLGIESIRSLRSKHQSVECRHESEFDWTFVGLVFM